MFARHLASSQGWEISYLEAGAVRPVVLLHGVGSAAISWRNQLSGLSNNDNNRIIAWDAPGYGGSTALSGLAPQAADYAARLADFFDILKLGPCHLVGHSLGALIAAKFAADFPVRVLSLTLASIATGQARLAPEERERLLSGRLGDLASLGARGMAEKRGPRLVTAGASEDIRRAVIETMAAIRPGGYSQAVRMLSQGDTLTDVARLAPTMPVQIIFGDSDVVTSPEQNLKVAAERPDAPVHIIENAGHAVYLEQSDKFNCLVDDFIQANDRPQKS